MYSRLNKFLCGVAFFVFLLALRMHLLRPICFDTGNDAKAFDAICVANGKCKRIQHLIIVKKKHAAHHFNLPRGQI